MKNIIQFILLLLIASLCCNSMDKSDTTVFNHYSPWDDNPYSRWIFRNDTCVYLDGNEVLGVFSIENVGGDSSADRSFYRLKSIIYPYEIAKKDISITGRKDSSFTDDDIVINLNLPNYPDLPFKIWGAYPIKHGETYLTACKRIKSNTIRFTLWPYVSNRYTSRLLLYDFELKIDSTMNNLDITIPNITPSLINYQYWDNEIIMADQQYLYFRHHTYKKLRDTDVSKYLKYLDPANWPPNIPLAIDRINRRNNPSPEHDHDYR